MRLLISHRPMLSVSIITQKCIDDIFVFIKLCYIKITYGAQKHVHMLHCSCIEKGLNDTNATL
jgi:hypothetical protein